jgi:hypothetical protein
MPATSAPSVSRSSGIAGIASGLLFVAAISTSKLPGGNDTPDDIVRYFGSRGHQATMLASAYLLAAAGLAFAWFLVGLLQRLRAAEGAPRPGVTFTGIGGAMVATLLVLAGGTFVALPAPLLFETGAAAGPATVAAGTVGIGVVVISMLAAGITILAASIVGSRAGTLPAWNARVGYVCGIVLVAGSVLYFSMILLPVWLIATGVTLIRSAEPGSASVPALRPSVTTQ